MRVVFREPTFPQDDRLDHEHFYAESARGPLKKAGITSTFAMFLLQVP